jgi:hypothetical protein
MLRRPVLGQLTNHTNIAAPTQGPRDDLRFKPTTTYDENQIHQELLSRKAGSFLETEEFEIFCDTAVEQNQAKVSKIYIEQRTNKCTRPLEEFKADSPMLLDMSIDLVKCETTSTDMADDLVPIDDEDEEDDDVEVKNEAVDNMDLAKQRKREALERERILTNCEEYGVEILKNMREAELRSRPKPNYLKQQQDISPSMRSILVDWLVEVSEEYNLHTETLYLAVNYTDRFLSKMSVLRGKLQLLGTASMYIAR